MAEDSIIREVRTAREAFAESHGYDIASMVADLREQDSRGDWPVVRLAPRRPVHEEVSRPGNDHNATRPAEWFPDQEATTN